MQVKKNELSFFNTLNFKFIICLVIAVLILMAFFTLYLVKDFAGKEKEIYQENFTQNLNLLANTSSNYLWDFEYNDLRENAAYFFKAEELVEVIIKDENNEIIVELKSPDLEKGNLLRGSKKIYYNDNRYLGKIEISYTDYFYQIRIDALRNRLIMLSLLITILLIIVISLVSKKTFKPLKTLVQVIKNTTKDNFDNKIEEYRNDEIGVLAESFNYMIDEINAGYQQLEAYNQEITALNEELSYQAFHDPLTGIPNRRKIINILENELKRDSNGALILLDINDFKEINDNYGHIYGDHLLAKVAQRLLDFSSENISVARYGGDEFLILIKNKSLIDIEKEILEIKKNSAAPFSLKANKVYINFAFGIALYPQDAKTTNQLITKADIAMYEAKKANNNDYLYYNQKMIDQLKRRKMIKNKLQTALKNDGFKLCYQPQVNLKTGNADFIEALLRFKRNTISPAEFIPIAEKSGLIIEIGRWVTKEAVKQLSIIKNEYKKDLKISINFSPKQIRDKNYLSFLKSMLQKYEVKASSLEIEITESILIEDSQSIEFINKLKKIGVQIALDDFGTGYSSFSYLGYLNVDKVKLDKFLADNFMDNDSIETLINLINLLHSLDLPIVAEGIETKEQYLKLAENQCNYIQGYLFSKPLEQSEIKNIIEVNYIDDL